MKLYSINSLLSGQTKEDKRQEAKVSQCSKCKGMEFKKIEGINKDYLWFVCLKCNHEFGISQGVFESFYL